MRGCYIVLLLLLTANGCAIMTPVQRTSHAQGVTVEYLRDRRTNWDDGYAHRTAGVLVTLIVRNTSKRPLRIDLRQIELKRAQDSIMGAPWEKTPPICTVEAGYEMEIGVVFDARLEDRERGEITLARAVTVDGAAADLPPLVMRGDD